MTRRLPALALLLAALAAPANAQSGGSHDALVVEGDAPDWLPMEAAVAQAEAEGKLVLVYGFAEWCGFCVRFDREVFTDDAVQTYLADHFAATRIDIESADSLRFHDVALTARELGRAMGVSGTPTNVFVDADGSLITKMPGYQDPETFLLALQYVREEAYETTPFDAFLVERRTGLDLTPATDPLVAPPPEE